VAYALELHRRARRYLERLSLGSPDDFARIAAALDDLAGDPRPAGSAKLHARGPVWKLRVGEYRIVYAIFDPDKLVSVEEIMRRSTRSYKER